jgi:hypothetical protein
MPDHCGTIDAMIHLMGAQPLIYAMLDQGDEFKETVRIMNQGWAKAVHAFYEAARIHCAGSVHAWMHLWAPGLIQQMQCDFSVMISPEMFNEFVLPELEQQIECIEYPVYHFDGIEQEVHLNYILGLKKLKAIQWTHVAGQPSASHYIPVLQRIQAAGKGLIVMAPKEDVVALIDNLKHRGLYIHTSAIDVEEAKDILRYVEDHTHG